MKNLKLLVLSIVLFICAAPAWAVVVSGSASVGVYNDNMKQAEANARSGALMNALQNYFGSLSEDQPDQPLPQVTPEYFKFIRSYRITDRHFDHGRVIYSVMADIDKVSLSDVAYMIHAVSSTAVFVVRGVPSNPALDSKVASALGQGGFSTRYQSDFMSTLPSADPTSAVDTFKATDAEYLFDIFVEPVSTGTTCTAAFTAKVYGKDSDFNPIKVNSDGTGATDADCIANAATGAMQKILSYVKGNYISVQSSKEKTSLTIIAANYSNFATPKNLMETLKKKTLITNYTVKGFEEKSLQMDVESYISADMLIKKLQALQAQYDFVATKTEDGNILLDFSGQQ